MLAAVAAHVSAGGNAGSYVMSTQAMVQLVASTFVMLWAVVATFVVGKVVAVLCGGLRVPADDEDYGTDLYLAEPDAYSAA